jgi:acyl transferase domain-containing protein
MELTVYIVKWDKYNFKVPTKPTPWPKDRLQRVSVNCFGVGGANAHVSYLNLLS